MAYRDETKQIRIGSVTIGGGNPVAIQSMTNTATQDVEATVAQILRLEEAGCEIVRCTVPDEEAASAIAKIKKQIHIPLVADIHFDYKMAIRAMENGADKIRINPGNIGGRDRIRAVVDCAKEREIPIRVGVNSGSLERELVEKYGGVTPEGLVESALDKVRTIEDCGYDNIVISIKSTDVPMTIAAHKLIAGRTPYPLHVGITEAGGDQGGEDDPPGSRHAQERHRGGLVPDLRTDEDRSHRPRFPGGDPGAVLSGSADQGRGHGLRGQRTRRSERGRHRHRGRPGRRDPDQEG